MYSQSRMSGDDSMPQATDARLKKERRLRAHETGQHIYSDALKEMGVIEGSQPPDLSDDELLFQAFLDKMEERGMQV